MKAPGPPHHPARDILRATATTGLASVINILLGILRTKVVALVLGPAGVGLYGVLNTLLHSGRTALARGLSTAGSREIAAASNNAESLSSAISAVRAAALAVALGSGALIVLLSPWLASWAFHEPGHTWQVALLGLAIFFAVMAANLDALLTGLGKVWERSLCFTLSAVASTIIAVIGVVLWGFPGLVLAVVCLPILDFLFLSWQASRMAPAAGTRPRFRWDAEVSGIAFSGMTVSAAVLIGGATQLAARRFLIGQAGIEEAGLYHAAAIISMLYVGVVLNSLVVDFMPRLSKVQTDPIAAQAVINQQLNVSVLLVAPLCIAGVAFSPLAIWLLYSDEFIPAAGMLRWQMLGEALKAPLWVMSSVALAKGSKGIYLALEIAGNALYLSAFYLLYPRVGLSAGGMAFLLYAAFGCVAYWCVLTRHYGYRPDRRIAYKAMLLMVCLGSVLWLTLHNQIWGMTAGTVLTLLCAVMAVRVFIPPR